jgi:hypothetical protein
MKSITIQSMGALPTFTKIEADSGYWTERASYEISKTFREMNLAGMGLSEPETSDFTTWQDTTMPAFAEQVGDWVTDTLNHRALGEPENIVDPPDLIGLISDEISFLLPSSPSAYMQILSMAANLQCLLWKMKAEYMRPIEEGNEGIKEALLDIAHQEQNIFYEGQLMGNKTSVVIAP